jgi:hypothetical protein
MTIQSPASGGGNGITIKRNDNGTDQRVGAISFGNTVDSDLAQITVQTSAGNNGDGNLLFHTQPNGGSSTEAMRIDSSGNVGIGVTPETWSSSTALQLTPKLALWGDTNQSIISHNMYVNSGDKYLTTGAASLYTQNSGTHRWLYAASGTVDTAITFSEAMRIANSGNLLVGTTSDPAGSERIRVSVTSGTINGMCAVATTTAGGSALVNRNSSNTYVGGVTFTDTATSFPTSSDQRLKENILDAPSASDDIDAIQVRSFDWKANGSHQKYGMIAQELITVAPEAVYQPEDPEEIMGVDYSKLVPMMLKEIQSLRARVAQLEGAN